MEDTALSSVILFKDYKCKNQPQQFDLHSKKLEQWNAVKTDSTMPWYTHEFELSAILFLL